MTPITIPQLDANLIDVTITRWHKQIGETVVAGESVAELTTDKATYELEASASGTLLIIYAAVKSVVPAGATIAMLGDPDEIPPATPPGQEQQLTAYRGETVAAAATPSRDRGTRIRATPRARRLAMEHKLDLAKIKADTNAEVITEAILEPYLK